MKKILSEYQAQLQEDCVNKAGINIVTCGECGLVFLHEVGQETLVCPHCQLDFEPCDCPDLYFKGMSDLPYKVGDTVNVNKMGSFGDDGTGVIKKIITQYEKRSGRPYKVVILEDGHEFDYKNGKALTPPTAYFISARTIS